MHLTLRQLQIFLAVARTGSTTAAANAVSLSQSATSAALNELESQLAIKLFDRIGNKLVLNDSGRVLLPQAHQLLDAAANIEQQFDVGDALSATGLHIGASTTIGSYLLPTLFAPAGCCANPVPVRVKRSIRRCDHTCLAYTARANSAIRKPSNTPQQPDSGWPVCHVAWSAT